MRKTTKLFLMVAVVFMAAMMSNSNPALADGCTGCKDGQQCVKWGDAWKCVTTTCCDSSVCVEGETCYKLDDSDKFGVCIASGDEEQGKKWLEAKKARATAVAIANAKADKALAEEEAETAKTQAEKAEKAKAEAEAARLKAEADADAAKKETENEKATRKAAEEAQAGAEAKAKAAIEAQAEAEAERKLAQAEAKKANSRGPILVALELAFPLALPEPYDPQSVYLSGTFWGGWMFHSEGWWSVYVLGGIGGGKIPGPEDASAYHFGTSAGGVLRPCSWFFFKGGGGYLIKTPRYQEDGSPDHQGFLNIGIGFELAKKVSLEPMFQEVLGDQFFGNYPAFVFTASGHVPLP